MDVREPAEQYGPRVARRSFLAAIRNVDPLRVDAAIGALLGAAIAAQVWLSSSGGARFLGLLGGFIFGAGVALRRGYPLAGISVILAVLALKAIVGSGQGPLHNATGALPALLLMIYGLGAFAPPRRSLPFAFVVVVMSSVDVIVTKHQAASALVPTLVVGVLPYTLG